MAAIRRDITASPTDANRFVQGVLALKSESIGVRASEIGIPGGPLASDVELSWWDAFVIWHSRAMRTPTGGGRNAAHSGPVFLPWHRWFMIVLEFHLQRALGLGRDDFGLPYWDWGADGDLPDSDQRTAAVWDILGGDGIGFDGNLETGPFSVQNGFVVTIDQNPSGDAAVTNRPLRRRLGTVFSRLPNSNDVAAVLRETVYDTREWDAESPAGLRNILEGFTNVAAHNHVHAFVGGDMLQTTSPNDPAFYLNHCNVDRIWAQWQAAGLGRSYLPAGQSAGENDILWRHRSLDPLYSLLTQNQPQVAALEDVSSIYVYE